MRERIDSVRNHLKNNKKVYITGAVCLAVGAVGGGLYFRQVVAVQKAQNIALVNWKPVNNLTQTVELVRRGHPGYVIKCNETGETFASIRRTASAMDLNRSLIRNQMAGLIPDVDGFTFQNLGEATTAIV